MRETLNWVWGMVRNPEVVWENEDGTVAETEKVKRFGSDYLSRWDLRPLWMHTALTTRAACGCRKRFGIWPTMWCSKHVDFALDDRDAA